MKFEEWLSQQGGLIEVDCGCVTAEAFYHWLRVAYESGTLTNEGTIQSGNSAQPVTAPAGYVLVPVEPTTNQWAAGMQAFDSGMDKVTRVYKAMLDAAPKAPDGWVPVSERMPEAHKPVYIFHPDYGVDQGVWYDNQEDAFLWDSDNSRCRAIETVSHWMPMPALPDAPKVKP